MIKIAVASGKGGTGKTTVSTALAEALGSECSVSFFDTDVEEPNGSIFLKTEFDKISPVFVKIPVLDDKKCLKCGGCASFCKFKAIIFFGDLPMIFPELCHSCGGCVIQCKGRALTEINKEIGVISSGKSGKINFFEGKINIGYPMATPLIKNLRNIHTEADIEIIDAPPGTSCSMINAVKDVDFVILVTEPTPFGVHDLGIALETVRGMYLKCGVIINRSESEKNMALQFCEKNNVPILLQIPFSEEVAKNYSVGKNILETMPQLKKEFLEIIKEIKNQTGKQ